MEDCNKLLLQCAKQDTNAFKQLYELTSPRLYSLCLRLLRQEELAKDVLQEGFVKIWAYAHTYVPRRGKAITWMSTVVRNKALDKLRSLKVRPIEIEATYEGIEFASRDLSPTALMTLSQDTRQLLDCLNKLKPEQKDCILYSFYHGHTHEELSQKLSRPLGTVKAWIRRGLQRLRLCLE